MSQTPTDFPHRWRPADLEALRIALLIPATPQAVRAINDAMAQLEQGYPDAIPTAISELEAIQQLDGQLAALSIDQLQAPTEITRKAAADGVLTPGEPPPVAKADVLEYATDLLKEEIKTRYGSSSSPAQLLQQRRQRHAQALVLMLPSLQSWSQDPGLNPTSGGGGAFSAALQRS